MAGDCTDSSRDSHSSASRKFEEGAMPRTYLAGLLLAVGAIVIYGVAAQPPTRATPATTAAVLWQPSMNVFRRFDVPAERMYEFYGGVLGFEQLSTLNVGNGGGVARFQAGAQELKLTRRVGDRSYRPGGVRAATGLRLLTFYFADEAALSARFVQHGLPAPQFEDHAPARRRSALVQDPDGQDVELVVVPGATPEQLGRIEIGITVADLERSREFYRHFVGLEELPPVDDERFGTRKYSYRHGATTVSLRSFGRDLPADTGSGGIQYVVSDVEAVDALAKERAVPIDQPLSGLPGFNLRTIWLDDPDGVTNYFAETGQSRQARAASDAR
jgi:catechol 2,3-dioxygenase-like lactoylglutathione lyase family enzyme